MSSSAESLLCHRCHRPVEVSRDQFDVFEHMHYVCFHYEFEHDPADPDEECTAPVLAGVITLREGAA